MEWRVCKLIVEDYAKNKKIAGEFKALLATLMFKRILTDEEVKSICTWGEPDYEKMANGLPPAPLMREVKSGWF